MDKSCGGRMQNLARKSGEQRFCRQLHLVLLKPYDQFVQDVWNMPHQMHVVSLGEASRPHVHELVAMLPGVLGLFFAGTDKQRVRHRHWPLLVELCHWGLVHLSALTRAALVFLPIGDMPHIFG